jgi:hypothetical protein
MKFSQPLERCVARGAAAAVAIGLATAGLALSGAAANADGTSPDGGVTTSDSPSVTTTPTANAPVTTPAPAAPTAAAVGPIATCQGYAASAKVRIKDLSKRYIAVKVKAVPGLVPLFPQYRIPKGTLKVRWGDVPKTYRLNKSNKGVLKIKAPRSVKTKKVEVIVWFYQKHYKLSAAQKQCGVAMAELVGSLPAIKTVRITKR